MKWVPGFQCGDERPHSPHTKVGDGRPCDGRPGGTGRKCDFSGLHVTFCQKSDLCDCFTNGEARR